MAFAFRTDLACERQKVAGDIPGIVHREYQVGPCRIHSLFVPDTPPCAAASLRAGHYSTLFFRPVWEADESELREIGDILASLLRDAATHLTRRAPERCKILVAGLGNRALTVDAIGPRTADRIHATAHLKTQKPDLFRQLDCGEIAVLAPGTAAQSGMESAALIRAAANLFSPHLILTVDALAARATDRLASTIQLADSGTEPGSGIGNRRMPVNAVTMGCPVLSVGAPTVTDTATLVQDALLARGLHEDDPLLHCASDHPNRSFFVAPRDCDEMTDRLSLLLAHAVNAAFGFFCD